MSPDFCHRSYSPLPVLCLLSALCLMGCGEERAERPEVSVAPIPEDALVSDFSAGEFGARMIETTAGDIATLNPLVNESSSGSAVIGRILDSLVTLDPHTGEVIPNLAKSWEISDDNLTYTFYLREGVHWSDGAPFTADDIIFTWNCFFAKERDPETREIQLDENGQPIYRYNSRSTFSQQINGQEPKFEKIDEYTVRFTTPEVYAPFLLFGGGVEIFPPDHLETGF